MCLGYHLENFLQCTKKKRNLFCMIFGHVFLCLTGFLNFFFPSRHPRGKKNPPYVHDNRQLFWWTIKFLASEISQLIQMRIWPLKFFSCWGHRKYMTKPPLAKNWNQDFPLLWRLKSNCLTLTVFQVFTTISCKTESVTQSKANVYIHSGIL